MLRLIKFLITGDWHLHKYKIHNQRNVSRKIVYDDGRTLTNSQIEIIQICEHCGKLKQFETE